VTCLPDARFSTRSFAVTTSGTGSAPAESEAAQWQSDSGQPHRGHIRPCDEE